jgi:hypothetical protein
VWEFFHLQGLRLRSSFEQLILQGCEHESKRLAGFKYPTNSL